MARNNVVFYLGPAVGLSERKLTITAMRRAGEDVALAASYDTALTGTTENVTVPLKINRIWQAVLKDTKTSGEVGESIVLNFSTGSLLFPGPAVGPEMSLFRVLAMEDLSSSSSSSLNSSSSSSSSSSNSSSSSSSSSSNSSSSSLNSSSSSSSSLNSSSSSSSSLNSSSSSSSNSSSSSSSSSSKSSQSSSSSSSS